MIKTSIGLKGKIKHMLKAIDLRSIFELFILVFPLLALIALEVAILIVTDGMFFYEP